MLTPCFRLDPKKGLPQATPRQSKRFQDAKSESRTNLSILDRNSNNIAVASARSPALRFLRLEREQTEK